MSFWDLVKGTRKVFATEHEADAFSRRAFLQGLSVTSAGLVIPAVKIFIPKKPQLYVSKLEMATPHFLDFPMIKEGNEDRFRVGEVISGVGGHVEVVAVNRYGILTEPRHDIDEDYWYGAHDPDDPNMIRWRKYKY